MKPGQFCWGAKANTRLYWFHPRNSHFGQQLMIPLNFLPTTRTLQVINDMSHLFISVSCNDSPSLFHAMSLILILVLDNNIKPYFHPRHLTRFDNSIKYLYLFMPKQWHFGIYFHSFLQGWNLPLFSEGTPLSGYLPLSEANLKSYPPSSFYEPSKLVHINCKKHFKWRCYVSYYTESNENIITIALFTFRLNFVFYYLHFLWLDIAFNVFHTWCARGMNMKHF